MVVVVMKVIMVLSARRGGMLSTGMTTYGLRINDGLRWIWVFTHVDLGETPGPDTFYLCLRLLISKMG